MRNLHRCCLLGLVAAVTLLLIVFAGGVFAFDQRWRSVRPPMTSTQVKTLLGTGDALGTAEVLGKEDRSDVLWAYWRGLWIYNVQFDADTNDLPTTVYATWHETRFREGDWFPPRK